MPQFRSRIPTISAILTREYYNTLSLAIVIWHSIAGMGPRVFQSRKLPRDRMLRFGKHAVGRHRTVLRHNIY